MNDETITPLSEGENHHEILMQLEAIIFASESPVSLARLKEAFQDQFTKKQLSQFLDFNCGANSAELVNNYDWFKNYSFLRK